MALTPTQIPYLRACNGKRWGIFSGCNNDASICEVKAKVGRCWAESEALVEYCYGCTDFNSCSACLPFAPTFHRELLHEPERTRRGYVIAVAFGGDMFCEGIESEDRREVFEVEAKCPGHAFAHLTKCPENISYLETENMKNGWFGVSITQESELGRLETLRMHTWLSNHLWVSFEPVLGSCGSKGQGRAALCKNWIEFAVIGGLSDGRHHVLSPDEGGTRAEWIQPILDACAGAGIPMFVKNVQPIYRKLINPRTGKTFKKPTELRELPQEWVALRG